MPGLPRFFVGLTDTDLSAIILSPRAKRKGVGVESFKLRLKVGEHEFEAEGPKAVVQAQFEAWKALIMVAPLTTSKQPAPNTKTDARQTTETKQDADPFLDLFEAGDGNSVTLRAYPSGEQADDAVLLVAYAFKRLHNVDILSSVLLGKSLRLSGGTIDRVDRVVNNQIAKGFMMKAGGIARGTKYRLTTTGAARAEALSKELFGKLN